MPGINQGIEKLLACPDCLNPLQRVSYNAYQCNSDSWSVTYEPSVNLLNLLPKEYKNKGKCREKPSEDFLYKDDETGHLIELTKSELHEYLDSVHHGDMRRAEQNIRHLIQGLYHEEGRVSKDVIGPFSRAHWHLFEKYREKFNAEEQATLLGIVSLARYEAELQYMRDYPGNFVPPDSIIDKLPTGATVVEVGMGNGATLREVAKRRAPEHMLGFDNCYGMVEAATNITNSDDRFFYALGDAHNIPLLENSVDVFLLLDTLDRLQSPTKVLDHIRRVVKPGGFIVMGNCMPLQYDVKVGNLEIPLVLPEERFDSVEAAISSIEGTEIVGSELQVPWNPVTVTQPDEKLLNDVFVAQLHK